MKSPAGWQARSGGRARDPGPRAARVQGRGGETEVACDGDEDDADFDRRIRRTRLDAAVRTLEISTSAQARISASWLRSGLGMKSTAPSSSA